MVNHYQVLGIEPDATAAQIKDAYRRAAMRWHPDRNRDNIAEAERRFKQIGAAYAVLSDSKRRQHYDDQIRQAKTETDDSGFDAESAAEMFMREMVEMATAMAATGYNKDVLFGALLSQGVPQSIASELAARVIAARARAQASAAAQERANAQREREVERERQDAQRESEAREARQRKNAVKGANPSDSNGSVVLWLLGLCFALVIAVGLSSGRKESATSGNASTSQPQAAARAASDNKPAASSTSLVGQSVVAARKANVRGGPGVRFPVVTRLNRGDLVRPTNRLSATTFIEIELPDGKKGWIGQELLIDAAAARVLSNMTAKQYVDSRSVRLNQMVSESDLLNFTRALSTSNPANANPSAESLIATVRTLAPVSTAVPYPRDVDALRWWSLEGRWQSDNGGAPMEVVMAAIAAVYADPNDSGALVALGMAAMKAGFFGQDFDRVVRALTTAAPESTSTWVLIAASAAHRSQSQIARAALEVALGYSRDVKVTRAFIANVASESPVPTVAAAFGAMNSATSDAPPQTSLVSSPSSSAGNKSPLTRAANATPETRLQCTALSRYSESFDQQMSLLVRLASRPGTPPTYTADQAVFVAYLCANNIASAQEMIDSGKVKHEFAERSRQLLKASMPAFRSQNS